MAAWSAILNGQLSGEQAQQSTYEREEAILGSFSSDQAALRQLFLGKELDFHFFECKDLVDSYFQIFQISAQ